MCVPNVVSVSEKTLIKWKALTHCYIDLTRNMSSLPQANSSDTQEAIEDEFTCHAKNQLFNDREHDSCEWNY